MYSLAVLTICLQDYPDDEVQRGDLLRAQFESNMAALKTAVRLTENLQLRLSDDLDPPDGTRNVTSRLFHRYFHIFLGALAPQNKLSSSMDFDSQAVSPPASPCVHF